MLNTMLIQLGADDAELAGSIGSSGAQVHLTRHKVEVNPGAVLSRKDAFRTENHTVGAQIQFLQSVMHKVHGELLVGFRAPGSEDLVGMVMMVVVIMAAAGTVRIVVMMVMFMVVMMVMVVTAVAMFIMAVMMVLMVMMMVMMVFMLMTVLMLMSVLMVMRMIVIMAAAGAVLVVVMVVMMLGCLHLCNDLCDGGTALHGFL